MSVNSVNTTKKKSSPIISGLCFGAGIGTLIDLGFEVTAHREKSYLNSIEQVRNNIKPSMPSIDCFKSCSEDLSAKLKTEIDTRTKLPLLKRLGNILLESIGLGDMPSFNYNNFKYFKQDLDKIGDINEIKKHVNEAGHKSLERLYKLGKQFEGSTIKTMSCDLYHQFKCTFLLSAAGLGIGILVKLFKHNSNKNT